MAINWNEYELVLKERSSKECEVTGRDMGGTDIFTCPISKLQKGLSPKWTPESGYGDYGGYQSYQFTFKGTDDESVHVSVYKHYHIDVVLKPGEEWSDGWYEFGSWSYCVSLSVRKIEQKQEQKHKQNKSKR